MPWIVPERNHAGISNGVNHLLSHGVTADFGVICKPWDDIYYEHPGMVWFKVTVWGTMGYAGIPRGVPGFRSSIIPAAKVILDLEEWLEEYPDKHTSDQVKPQGWISALRCGWPDKPAFPGAATEIWLDVRTSPLQKAAQVEREFDQVMKAILDRHDDVDAEWETIVTCDASATDPEHWVGSLRCAPGEKCTARPIRVHHIWPDRPMPRPSTGPASPWFGSAIPGWVRRICRQSLPKVWAVWASPVFPIWRIHQGGDLYCY